MKRLLTVVAVILGFLSAGGWVLAAPPEHFQKQELLTGLNAPTDMVIAPDERMFLLEKSGAIRIYKDGQLLPEPFTQISVNHESERGLLGIALDPDYENNKQIFVYYTGSDLINRVARYDASDDLATTGGEVVYQVPISAGLIHLGGSIGFGNDGKLYVAIGNNGVQSFSQNLTNDYGKILRLNPDGSIPEDNPFVGDDNKKSEIWAYGLRNPFRFHFDSVTGRFYAGDVGDNAWEEINLVQAGEDYGYPETEGACEFCPFVNPIYQYFHEGGHSYSVTGGPVYRGSMFPAEYYGSLFFGDYGRGFIKRLTLNSSGNSTGVYDFDLEAGPVVDMEVGPDGALYFLTIFPGRLFKITYASDNLQPIAVATADLVSGDVPLTVKFSSEGSYDPEDEELTYNWDFGDGTSSNEAHPSKTYEQTGEFSVRLAVSDGTHTVNAPAIQIEVGGRPSVTIAAPLDGSHYNAGDTITYQATAMDSDGDPISEDNIRTEVILHHNTHTHPFEDRPGNVQGSFTVPNKDNHPDANTWFEIKVTATASNGLSQSESVFIYPNTVQLSFATEPNGMVLYLDAIPVTAPHSLQGVVGFEREIRPQLIQQQNGQLYHFSHWTDGGQVIKSLTTPAENSTYTAHFTPMPPFFGEYFDNMELVGEPIFTREDPTINFFWNDGSPDPSVPVNQFSARWTKQQQFAEGRYRFTTSTDDGVRLYINDQLIIDKWYDQGTTDHSQVIYLPTGEYDLRMEYYENWSGATARLHWTPTLDAPTVELEDGGEDPGGGNDGVYTAEYYPNKHLDGEPTLVRQEEFIDHSWHWDAPDPSLPADQFSARWTKTAHFDEGVYRFAVTADDGLRLYIDGVRVIDRWYDQMVTTHTIEKYLPAGEHTIVLEYFENYGGAFAKLEHQRLTHMEGFAAEYFDNMELAGDPLVVKTDQELKFIWGYGQPHWKIPKDQFSVRWVTVKELEAGRYHFLLRADDGVRFWVNDELIVDDWTDHPMRTYEHRLDLPAGSHQLKVEFYENGGSAVAILEQL